MASSINRRTVIGAWLGVLVVVAGAGALSGVPVTMATSALWLLACVVPTAVMLLLWREPPQTLAEIIHSARSTRARAAETRRTPSAS